MPFFDAESAAAVPAVLVAPEVARASDGPDLSVPPESARPFGSVGSWRLNLEGDWIGDFSDANELQGRIGAAWFFAQHAEIAFYGTGGYAWQSGGDAATYGLDAEIRWHCIARADWTIFLSVGGSVMGSTSPIPSDGSSFNFTPSLGFGGTIEVADDLRLYLSARWYHISNAGLYADNPGRDNLSLWAGLSFGL